MGEVYRARDTKLDRDVAIKVLPEAFAGDPERTTRFQREAKTLASLNHPNIAIIHGLEQAGNIQALVMELVEGEDLSQRLVRGPIPLEEALAMARQIAEALEAAHEHGIVHRDLKPANIKVTPDGVVKVLDFGLAKLTEASGAGREIAMTQSPTITSPAMMTGVGVILGTAAYMSPEQARGREADKRSDIWAFGCVLFEMLTGRRPFEGDDVADLIAVIIRGEPDWTLLPADLPASIRAAIQKCLEKDRTRRLADIAVAQYLLNERAAASSDKAAVSASTGQRRGARALAAVVIATVCGAVAAALVVWFLMAPVPARISRFEIVPPATQPLAETAGANAVAISPDGSTIVYHAEPDGVRLLVVRRLAELEPKAVAGTELATNPFFSPDGSRIGFVTGTQLKTTALAGGPPTLVCEVGGQVQGASWVGDWIVFAQAGTGLFRVRASGGRAQNVARPDANKGETDYRWPQILPGGKAILYTVYAAGGSQQARVAVRQIDSGDSKILVDAGNDAHYAPSGHLLYHVVPATTMAAPFDIGRLAVRGPAVPVLDTVVTSLSGVASMAVGDDGTLVYVHRDNTVVQFGVGLQWVDRNGKPVEAVASPGEGLRYPRLSPDGRAVAVTIGPPNRGNIWIIDLTGASQPRELTFTAHNLEPIWSPDGRSLIFTSDRDGQRNLFKISADGSALEPIRLTSSPNAQMAAASSPSGQWVLYRELGSTTRSDLLLLGADGTSRPWLQTGFEEDAASFSPDGRWVSYVSDQTGRAEVWVRPFSGPGAPIRISPDGGREPVWSRTGSELFYQSGRKLMMAEVASRSPDLRLNRPRMLFEGGFVPYGANFPRTYDVAADGRFLMLKEDQSSAPASLVVVQNWFEELKRLVPTK